ncbi:MAG: glycosyltransferase, partial [Planctomycetales bacterium]|nr:glycosyltransferase [Planctomycetales bacterium]
MKTPTISVVIPARNEQESIAACLDTVVAQQPHEVIVVDGGSEDATVATVRKSASQHTGVICVEAERGRAAQQNRGAALASGEVLLFLHADCELPPDGLSQVCDVVRRGA